MHLSVELGDFPWLGEGGYRLVEGIALAQVRTNHRMVARESDLLAQRRAKKYLGPPSQYHSSRDELLAAVDVIGRAGDCCVTHDVDGECSDVRRPDDAPDGQRRAELITPLVEVVAKD